MSRLLARIGSAGVLLFFAVMACLAFSDAIINGGIISSGDTDVFQAFYHTRGFTAREILEGNIPLWNPYIYSGSTFVMDPEVGLFYPLNVLYLLLSLPVAINTDVLLHMTFLAFFTFLWIRRRGYPFSDSLLAGLLMMFCGAYFMHTYAGHLGILATAAWSPLVLAVLDENAEKWQWEWFVLGLFATAMSFLAGHLQYVIITATVATLYAINLAFEKRQMFSLYCVLGCYVGGAFLAAIQILPAMDGLSESYRAELTVRYLGSFSFHPENLLTLVAPDFFGNMDVMPYWGKEYLWEGSAFIGVSGLFLAVYGMFGQQGRRLWVIAGFLLLVALGAHTPLFMVTSQFIPFLNKLRGHGKFIFGVTIILALLAVRGATRLRTARPSWVTVALLFVAAILSAVSAYAVGNGYSIEEWRQFMWLTGPADDRFAWYGNGMLFQDVEKIAQAQAWSAVSLYGVAAKACVLAILVAVVRYRPKMFYLVLGLAVFELFSFARTYGRTFPLERLRSPDLEATYTNDLHDHRIYSTIAPNRSMSYRLHDIDGYNSKIASQRYLNFFSAFLGPENWQQSSAGVLTARGRMTDMLRLRYINVLESGVITNYRVQGDPMPHLSLLDQFLVLEGESDIFAALADPSFDPTRLVLLEREPAIKPVAENPVGTVRITEEDTDHMVIEATLSKPEILLVTDSYSRHWRARPLEGSVQSEYEVLPANYILRAIPLSAGKHRFSLEFAPLSFAIGAWVSALSWLLFIMFGAWSLFRKRVSHAQ